MPMLHLTIRMPISEETLEELRPRSLDWDAVRSVVMDSEPHVDLYRWDFEDAHHGMTDKLHEVTLLLDDSERPTTVHELARLLLAWTDGPLPQRNLEREREGSA